MNRLFFHIVLLVLFVPMLSRASGFLVKESEIDMNLGSTESSLGVFWDNDIYFKTDYYYTNGVGIEFQSDLLRLKFLELYGFSTKTPATTRYRLSLMQKMYTPTNISSYAMFEKDRPYAGTMVLMYSKDKFTRKQKSKISLGIGSIGVPSGTEQTQRVIHQSLNNDTAVGWSHQVNTDILLNLYLSKDYLLVSNQVLDITGGYKLSLGTLESNTSGNVKLRVGRRKFLFDNSGIMQESYNLNSMQYYFYFSYRAQLTLHDATLHGGLFNSSENLHTINYGKTSPLVHHFEAGLSVGIKKFNVIVKAEQLSPEFTGGLSHRYGSIQLLYFF